METYYQVDERWERFGVNSQEDYLTNYLVKGHFHSGVPTDVKESFITVEYLLAHAYYYWPLYDEALNKALRILEIAIKLKAQQLGISLKTAKGKSKTLDSIIKEICAEKDFSDLPFQLERARKIRNSQMHPNNHSYFGATSSLTPNIKLFVGLINQLFQTDEWFQQYNSKMQQVDRKIKEFDNQLLKIATGMPLIKRVISFQIYENSLIISCEPIVNDVFKRLSNHQSVQPLCYLFNDFLITESGISGTNNFGEQITLQPTLNQQNINILEIYLEDIKKVSETDRIMYDLSLRDEAPWLVVEQEYELNRINIIEKVQGI